MNAVYGRFYQVGHFINWRDGRINKLSIRNKLISLRANISGITLLSLGNLTLQFWFLAGAIDAKGLQNK